MQPISGATPIRSTSRPAATANVAAATTAPAAVVKPAYQTVQAPRTWTTGRILAAGASGVGGFAAGNILTLGADLLFHFGNNGGMAWPGGIYLAAAGAAALGAIALYSHFSKK